MKALLLLSFTFLFNLNSWSQINLDQAKARWISTKIFSLRANSHNIQSVELYHSNQGGINVKGKEVYIKDKKSSPLLKGAVTGNFHNQDYIFKKRWAFLLDHSFIRIKFDIRNEQIDHLIKGQLVLIARDSSFNIIHATNIQKAGVIDEHFAHKNFLGVKALNDKFKVALWAPTAFDVKLLLFDDPKTNSHKKISLFKNENGTWKADLPITEKNKYYLYQVKVYNRKSDRVETNLVTDPYSYSLNINGKRSQIIDPLNDFKPNNWASHKILEHYSYNGAQDLSLYELHVRDFSALDNSITKEHRGKFKAFTYSNSIGMKHLKKLAKSGLSHIHLLPINDIGTINEDENQTVNLDDYFKFTDNRDTIFEILNSHERFSSDQQNLVEKIKDKDSFNWGYDPQHYMAVEGSYAVNKNGGSRILELREAIQSLHEVGLRVVVDVVFNHTNDRSIFEKIIPDYYYRLNHDGNITMDSCCSDTASEHKMVQKLIVDSAVYWVKTFKLDGLRFDLMSFLTKDTMLDLRNSLNQLTYSRDGVDGKKVYLYGEAWDFGSLKWLLPSESMNQWNTTHLGAGIGSFNNIFRDSIKGKGQNERELFKDDAYLTDKTQNRDTVKLALRGTLNDWWGGLYNGPLESINYLSAHDKATLWDHFMAKTGPWAPIEQIVKMQKLGISFLALSQGIPFFHAGVEILRSKSGDENSYNSGDWFNRLDYSMNSHNWNKGLPPAWQPENYHAWDNWRYRMERIPTPSKPQMQTTLSWFETMMQTRRSSKLFSLKSKEQIQRKVSFIENIFNTHGHHDRRLIVMKIDDTNGELVDSKIAKIFIAFNVSWYEDISFYDPDLKSPKAELAYPIIDTEDEYISGILNDYFQNNKAKAFIDSNKGVVRMPPASSLVFFVYR